MGVLHSFSIKNIFYDKMDLRLFYFDEAKSEIYEADPNLPDVYTKTLFIFAKTLHHRCLIGS